MSLLKKLVTSGTLGLALAVSGCDGSTMPAHQKSGDEKATSSDYDKFYGVYQLSAMGDSSGEGKPEENLYPFGREASQGIKRYVELTQNQVRIYAIDEKNKREYEVEKYPIQPVEATNDDGVFKVEETEDMRRAPQGTQRVGLFKIHNTHQKSNLQREIYEMRVQGIKTKYYYKTEKTDIKPEKNPPLKK